MKSILRKSYVRQSKYGHILSTIIKISVDVIISSSSVTTYSVSLCVALNADNTKRLFYWIWRSLFFSFERSNTNKFRVFFESCLSSKLFYFPQNELINFYKRAIQRVLRATLELSITQNIHVSHHHKGKGHL